MTSYADKLRDPRWQKRRLEIFLRDDWTCQKCGATESELSVHHKEYIKNRDPWDYPDDLLTTRCTDCHEGEHVFFESIGALLDQTVVELEEQNESKRFLRGVSFGYARLDMLTSGLQKTDLILIAARPSVGKTALSLNIARNVAIDSNVPVAIFSLEMSKQQLSMRMLCAEARVDSARLRSGFLNENDWAMLTRAAGSLTNAPLFIDDSPGITIKSIRARAKRLKQEKGLGLLIVDYIQLMQGDRRSERRDLEISAISGGLKNLAKELDIPIIALSQLNRKLEERSDKRPQLSDLKESGALEQDADIVIFIYRDEIYNRDENNPNRGCAEIIVAKQRNGPRGTVPLAFLSAYTRFEDLAIEEGETEY